MTDFRGWSSSLQFHPPLQQPGHLRRARLTSCIDERITQSHTALVVAPSGYGKTSSVAEWAATRRDQVAWVTLSRLDTDADRIHKVVLRALLSLVGHLSPDGHESLRRADSFSGASLAALDNITDAFTGITDPVYLVIDDAHRAKDALATGLLGALIDGGYGNLRVIIIGTTYTELALSRFALTNPRAVIRAADLAFDIDEVVRLVEDNGSALSPDFVWDATHGWPIAVRVLVMTGVNPGTDADHSVFHSYVKDYVLPSLPTDLAEFALLTSGCRAITPALANEVTGRTDSEILLDRCVASGLFIDRYESSKGSVYRWHSLFARHCRDILTESRPETAHASMCATASFVEADRPLEAAEYWLAVDQPEDAVRVVLSRWVGALIGPDAGVVDRFCAGLPAPWDDDPRVLLVRACIHRSTGESAYAAMLYARAVSHARDFVTPPGSGTDYTGILEQAHLFLIDDRDELGKACDVVRHRFEAEITTARDRAHLLYLLGWTEMRLRRSPGRTVEFLDAAVVEAKAIGALGLAHHSRNHLAFSHAWAGRFQNAREVIESTSADLSNDMWAAYAGGGALFASGFLAYWQNDLESAMIESVSLIRSADSPLLFGAAARMTLALAAAASRDSDRCRLALDELSSMPSRVDQGVSWSAFRHASLAVLNEAAGNHSRAMRIVSMYEHTDNTPMVTVVLAGIAGRARQHRRAAHMLHRLTRYQDISYVRVATLLTDAQVAVHDGTPTRAHDLLEHALDVAAGEDLRRLFAGDGVDLRQMLTGHLAWGTRHEDFLAACLAPPTRTGILDILSERESDVFAQLRTTRTMQEIAEHLGVSINTVKTHQRAIYRKLDVRSRREAVRFTR
ncbi:LuxR C-terminal-related transcriptional regulator [Gordonia sp. HY002]|uniref:helix-turn-helix transcriptional regulator n=1 Tax=Gordonia zhenghanii TaxID=2911516 RepID=UPI001EF08295|nr:LuxR C-terminal-related transcriptional regulator [Gordonia zhenghanii]MCF8571042.1 LuxR C-terminal-related transcriptional regulator [Gordonia zhenghanii]MCF8606386.1 LuxR C-terminal-related transcriptional regulator [Gordonia zhenghanii]